jgi:hypothetical protein
MGIAFSIWYAILFLRSFLGSDVFNKALMLALVRR